MSEPIRLEAAMNGVLAMLVVQREEAKGVGVERKSEVILHDAGLTNKEIAAVLGKTTGAVGMTISRSEGK